MHSGGESGFVESGEEFEGVASLVGVGMKRRIQNSEFSQIVVEVK